MQSPEYAKRRALLEYLAAPGRSRWTTHGMRDIVPIIAGMVAQLALSFCRRGTGYAILWRDISNDRMYITSDEGVIDVRATPIDARVELGLDGDKNYRLFVAQDKKWQAIALDGSNYTLESFWIGNQHFVSSQVLLNIYTHYHPGIYVDRWVVAARFGEKLVPDALPEKAYWQDPYSTTPYRVGWLDSNGRIRIDWKI